jgi:hypothetical protein
LFSCYRLVPCSWKTWASLRFVHYWGEFLRHPDAAQDPQHAAIRSMYETTTGAATKPSGASSGAGGTKAGAGRKAKKT